MPITSRAGRVACVSLALLATACGAPLRKKEVSVFFPQAPELPRIQYLTSFSGLRDVEEQSAFDRFVVGEKPDVKLDKPYGVAVHDGKIYVCDTNATVVVFDLKGKSFGTLRGAVGPGRLVQPVNIGIDADGTKYVADPVRGQVVVFDGNDEYINAFGVPGTWKPVDAAAFEGRLYVADAQNGVVEVLDAATGERVATVGDKGEPAERLSRPTNLALDRDGNLYVSDFGRFQVVEFDREGRFKATFGKLGDSLGYFARPKGIAIDREGRLYAADASFNNVQIFNNQGRLLMFFGEGGDAPGNFLLPAKVVIDYDNIEYFRQYVLPDFEVEYLVFVTSQFGHRQVSVLAYGKEKGKSYPADAELLGRVDERRNQEIEKRRKP